MSEYPDDFVDALAYRIAVEDAANMEAIPMTFDEWWEGKFSKSVMEHWTLEDAAISAWDAAIASEQEACAQLAEDHGFKSGNIDCQGCGEDIAKAIRARSKP